MSRLVAIVSTAVLLSIGLRYSLPIVDPYAAEYDPWHTHVVIGAGSPAEVDLALANHQHRTGGIPSPYAGQRPASQPAGQAGRPGGHQEPRVINIANQQDSRVSLIGIGTLAWLSPVALCWALLLTWFWQSASSPAVFNRGFHLLPLIPPPRFG